MKNTLSVVNVLNVIPSSTILSDTEQIGKNLLYPNLYIISINMVQCIRILVTATLNAI